MNDWISVKDKMPEPYTFVLVHEKRTGSGEPCPTSIARLEEGGWNGLGDDEDETNAFWSNIFWNISWENITHWMPLPKPPNDD